MLKPLVKFVEETRYSNVLRVSHQRLVLVTKRKMCLSRPGNHHSHQGRMLACKVVVSCF